MREEIHDLSPLQIKPQVVQDSFNAGGRLYRVICVYYHKKKLILHFTGVRDIGWGLQCHTKILGQGFVNREFYSYCPSI